MRIAGESRSWEVTPALVFSHRSEPLACLCLPVPSQVLNECPALLMEQLASHRMLAEGKAAAEGHCWAQREGIAPSPTRECAKDTQTHTHTRAGEPCPCGPCHKRKLSTPLESKYAPEMSSEAEGNSSWWPDCQWSHCQAHGLWISGEGETVSRLWQNLHWQPFQLIQEKQAT